MEVDFVLLLTIYALAIFVGFEIITKVPPTLHTPLMSGSNAISGITIIGALISWFVWAYLTYFIGTKILPEPQTRANHGELLRTIGFSSAPGLIQVLGIIPAVGILVMPVASIWMLIAMVIAVRQALDYSGTLRAVGVCIIGWIFLIIIRAVLLSLFR